MEIRAPNYFLPFGLGYCAINLAILVIANFRLDLLLRVESKNIGSKNDLYFISTNIGRKKEEKNDKIFKLCHCFED